jgi:hypothetical protein
MALLGFAGLGLARKWRMRTSVAYKWAGLSKREALTGTLISSINLRVKQ